MILFMIFFPITFLGSHVTSHEGMYILQWKYYDKLAHTHLSPLDSLTAAATTHVHKSKVNIKFIFFLSSFKSSKSMKNCQMTVSEFCWCFVTVDIKVIPTLTVFSSYFATNLYIFFRWCTIMRRSIQLTTRDQWPASSLARVGFPA